MTMDIEIMLDPEAHGYKECEHCNGYGSSLKDPEGVDTCTKCKGVGLVPKQEEQGDDEL